MRVLVPSVLLGAHLPAFADDAIFGFEDIAERARVLAAAPYQPPGNALPKELKQLSYHQYKDIRFNPQAAYWRDANLPFEIAFFHVGYFYDQPVRLNEITAEGVRPIPFDPSQFNYGKNTFDPGRLADVGFAGFRVHYPINRPDYKDEVVAFLGASYFRAVGKGQRYGLSARGLAIDTALPSGEEFPRFVEFWFERPAPDAEALTLYALLDSPRATGAYRFEVRPGVETVMDVKARLYLRTGVGKLGLAPLTSMYLAGENQHVPRDDYRPEVHDSDGLSIRLSTGEWIWRPLLNPKRLLVTSFAAVNPVGFGLMQRDRMFAHYEDLESRFELRPSAWVEPKGSWGAGRIELVQIPTPDETNDNIVAYWVPDAAPKPQEPYDFEYRLRWQKDTEVRPPSAWVLQTRRGRAYEENPDDSVPLLIEFDGQALRDLADDAAIESVATADGNGQIVENTLYRNDITGAWRVALRVRRGDAAKPVELRVFLRSASKEAISETWSYILPPD